MEKKPGKCHTENISKVAVKYKSVFSELTSEFIDKFIEVIRRIFLTNMASRDQKAALAHEWSKKLKSFRDSVIWRKLCREIPKNKVSTKLLYCHESTKESMILSIH